MISSTPGIRVTAVNISLIKYVLRLIWQKPDILPEPLPKRAGI